MDLRAARDLWRFLRAETVDVLHVHTPKPGVYGRIVGRAAGVPVVASTVHGIYALPTDRWLKRAGVYALAVFSARLGDVEFVVNAEDAELLAGLPLYPSRRLQLVGNGVDLNRFDPARFDGDERRRLRAAIGVGDGTIVVGAVGRLVREKGFLDLFAAAAALDGRYQIVVAGPADPEKPDALTAAEIVEAEAQGVTFLGMREDIERVYAMLDVFVLPSYREGLPQSAMEASAMALPVIATDVRGCRSVVRDGHTGWLVPRGDVAALRARSAVWVTTRAWPARSAAPDGRWRSPTSISRRSCARCAPRTWPRSPHRGDAPAAVDTGCTADMCGIVGVTEPGAERAVLAQLATLMHRGPDAMGVHGGQVATIGQTRLSVIDLVTGDPPITNEDGSVGVALNGEIYNFAALREQLLSSGHTFATAGDTEVLADLAEDLEPVELARRLDGMFAFAVVDDRRRRLVLGRDPLGKKPLFYWTDGDLLVFGSELKALLVHPRVPRRLDVTAVPGFSTFGCVPGPRTFFEGIRSVPPGHVLVAAPGEPIRIERYWSLPIPGVDGVETLDLDGREAAALVREWLFDAVRRRLVADVPVGAFLSGGLDSSAVVAAMVATAPTPSARSPSGSTTSTALTSDRSRPRWRSHLGTEHVDARGPRRRHRSGRAGRARPRSALR